MKKNHTNNINPDSKHILVLRLSAMGDVVLTLPVLQGLLNDKPSVKITLVTRPHFATFFTENDRLHIVCPDFKQKHRGILGLFRLYRELKAFARFDELIDLHKVLRTKVLSILFRLSGVRVFSIFKDRNLKKEWLRRADEPSLKHSVERYLDVFIQAGYRFNPGESPLLPSDKSSIKYCNNYLKGLDSTNKKLIGFAPYARHELKIWPAKHARSLLEMLSAEPGNTVFIFAGGKTEMQRAEELINGLPGCFIANMPFKHQLQLIQMLHCMISMDSANMHLAVMAGVPVISVWGATHPGMGFGPWNTGDENIIQISVDELNCRPCTIYGKGSCRRKDFACMERIEASRVMDKLNKIGFSKSL